MTKVSYLEELKAILVGKIPIEEINDILEYYSDYIDEALDNKTEIEVIASLNKPQLIAEELIASLEDQGVKLANPNSDVQEINRISFANFSLLSFNLIDCDICINFLDSDVAYVMNDLPDGVQMFYNNKKKMISFNQVGPLHQRDNRIINITIPLKTENILIDGKSLFGKVVIQSEESPCYLMNINIHSEHGEIDLRNLNGKSSSLITTMAPIYLSNCLFEFSKLQSTTGDINYYIADNRKGMILSLTTDIGHIFCSNKYCGDSITNTIKPLDNQEGYAMLNCKSSCGNINLEGSCFIR